MCISAISTAFIICSSAPIVDADRWFGFDVLVLFNDSFFMPLMFLLAGLFVWPGLDRKGPGAYWWGRLRRLGLPFLLAALTLMPIAYYPSFHMTGADAGFGRFWLGTVTTGPWPSGPPWFLPTLLAFDGAADGAQPRQWCAWMLAASAMFAILLGVQLVRLGGGISLPPAIWLGLYGASLAPFCAAAAFALIALFLRFPQRPPWLWAALSANAYGIYLLHYPVVTWLQYDLLGIRANAVLKASFVFTTATLVSWAGSAALRRLTGMRR